MAFVQLFIPSEIARTTISILGELGSVEFLDVFYLSSQWKLMIQLNSDTNAFQRSFVKEIRRCDEMERQLRMS
jgi:V-type H+-transporting ATPase subunit a